MPFPPAQALRLAHRGYVMRRGGIEIDGSGPELLARFVGAHPVEGEGVPEIVALAHDGRVSRLRARSG